MHRSSGLPLGAPLDSVEIMESDAPLAAMMIVALFGVTFQAWRLVDEKRVAAQRGAFSGPCGAGTAASWLL